MRKRFFLKVLIVFLLVFIGISIFQWFQLKKIIVISPKETINGLNMLNRQNLLLLDDKKISQILIKQNSAVKSAEVKKVFPSTLMISLFFREPKAIVVGDSFRLPIDEEGVFLPATPKGEIANLPVIDVTGISFFSSQKIDWRIEKALTFLKSFSKQSILFDRILINGEDSNLRIILPEETEVIVPKTDQAGQIAASLQIILSRFRIEGKLVKKVDFSFNKPIVVLANGEKIYSQ